MKRSALMLGMLAAGVVGIATAAQPSSKGKQTERTASGGSYTPVTPRGIAAGQIITKWSSYVQQVYGMSAGAWARNMAPTFAQADLANIQKAARTQTYEAMVATLVGQQTSDAKVITALAKSDGSLAVVQALGSPSEDLVYTMVNPCRIVDTRVAGGQIAGGFTRSFVSSGANFLAQGGENSTCGIPSDVSAAVINVTVVSPVNAGFITVYPFNTTRPNAASLNYVAGDIVGNELIAKQALAQASDFTVYTAQTAHVVIDIVGYFMAPNATALECTEVQGTTVAVPANGSANVFAGACPATYTAVEVQCRPTSFELIQVGSWTGHCNYKNPTAGSISASAASRCCRVPGR